MLKGVIARERSDCGNLDAGEWFSAGIAAAADQVQQLQTALEGDMPVRCPTRNQGAGVFPHDAR
ncbi:MAG: hypothetical protein P8Z78_15580 [Gammaproteobacteria bacterium]